MRIGNDIIIKTVDLADTRIIKTAGKEPDAILKDVEDAIVDIYRTSEVCFEELVESGELEIIGLPMHLQVLLYTRLKEMIDGDEIWIESKDEDFMATSLEQYLTVGPVGSLCSPDEDEEDDTPADDELADPTTEKPWNYGKHFD